MRHKKQQEKRPPLQAVGKSDSRRVAAPSLSHSPPLPLSHGQGYRLETPLICLFLLFGAFVAFGEACSRDFEFFNFDDDEYITQNPHVQAGLTAESVRWAFTTFHSKNWHPLTWMSLQLDSMLFGHEPWGYHLTNVMLHGANAVLLFLFFRYVTGAVWRSAMLAGLFLLHPQRVESVVWAAERKDVLSTLFWMLTMWTYVWWVRQPQAGRYLLLIVTFALGLMAKQMLVTLPFALLLLDYWPLGRVAAGTSVVRNPVSWRNRVSEKLPLFLLAAAASIITYQAQAGYRQPLSEISLSIRILNALGAYVQYLFKAVWPVDLCVLYLHPGDKLPAWQGIAAGAALAVVSWLLLNPRARRWPFLAVGWLWFLGTLVPVIGLVQVGIQAYADRYSYIPLIGIYLIVIWGAAEVAERCRWPKPALASGGALALLACLLLTWNQVRYWQTPLAMWQHTLDVEPWSYMAEGNVGQLIGDADLTRNDAASDLARRLITESKVSQIEAAEHHFRRAIQLEPTYDHAYLNLGIVLQRTERWDEAAAAFRSAIQIDPKSLTAARAHYRRGLAALMHGEMSAAIDHLFATVRIAPDFVDGHKSLGLVLDLQNKPKEAEDQFRQSLGLDRHNAPAHFYLGWSLSRQGQMEAARAEYAAGRALAPHWPKATAANAWFHATRSNAGQRNGRVALQLAQIANESAAQPDAAILDALAAALAEMGQFPEAVAEAKKAVELSEPDQKAAREKRLRLYEKGERFREEQPAH